jgi:hypothetical protein
MKRESNTQRSWSDFLPRGVKREKAENHSIAWRKGYTDYRFNNKGEALYLDKQANEDYEAGYKQAEQDEKDGREWRY